MQNNKYDNQVKENSKILEKEMPKLTKIFLLKGKFIGLADNNIVIGDTHEECFVLALDKFGHNTGFAISEISSKKLQVSKLIKFK